MLVMEGSSSTNTIMKDPDVSKTYGSGCPKNLRIRIHNTGSDHLFFREMTNSLKENKETKLRVSTPTRQKYPAI
jgi:hypothetical protein